MPGKIAFSPSAKTSLKKESRNSILYCHIIIMSNLALLCEQWHFITMFDHALCCSVFSSCYSINVNYYILLAADHFR